MFSQFIPRLSLASKWLKAGFEKLVECSSFLMVEKYWLTVGNPQFTCRFQSKLSLFHLCKLLLGLSVFTLVIQVQTCNPIFKTITSYALPC